MAVARTNTRRASTSKTTNARQQRGSNNGVVPGVVLGKAIEAAKAAGVTGGTVFDQSRELADLLGIPVSSLLLTCSNYHF